jgi:(E)-4-hydroxy-3-methylbut-2-enyl-diphosphate synthase
VRSKGINLIACPSCSRQQFDVVSTVNALEERLEDILEPMDVAVIGCVVNGPGEAREADIGLTGGEPNLLYVGGKPDHKVNDDELLDELERAVRAEVKRRQENPSAFDNIKIQQAAR